MQAHYIPTGIEKDARPYGDEYNLSYKKGKKTILHVYFFPKINYLSFYIIKNYTVIDLNNDLCLLRQFLGNFRDKNEKKSWKQEKKKYEEKL